MNYKDEYDRIESYLRELGLPWVCEQVREEIETGRLNEEKIATLSEKSHPKRQDGLFYSIDFRKGQAADFIKRSEYTDKQKLALLIEATKRAIPDLLLMEAQTTENFEDITSIKFISDKGESETFEMQRLDDKLVNEIKYATDSLKGLVDKLGGA